mgnify:CR=1 FL=1
MPDTPWLVIFDCDGVLVDSERLNVRTWTGMMRDAGVDFTEADAVETFVGKAYKDNRVTLTELTGAVPDPEWERAWRADASVSRANTVPDSPAPYRRAWPARAQRRAKHATMRGFRRDGPHRFPCRRRRPSGRRSPTCG